MISIQDIIDHHNKCELYMEKFKHGPWKNEPHRVDFRYRDHPCIVLRVPQTGHLCGYIGLKPGHKYYGLPSSHKDCDEGQIGAYDLCLGHGGITYGEMCNGNVCHMDDDGPTYWLGFDCAHAWDIQPGSEYTFRDDCHYRDVVYVAGQIRAAIDVMDS